MADRYTYLPQIGLCLSVTWGFAQFTAFRHHRRRICGIASVLAVLIPTGFAWRQTSYWQNGETLWTHALATTARNHVTHFNLGIVLTGRGQVDEAIAHYQKALEIKPDYTEAHYNLGVVLAGRGRVDEAIAHYRKALEIKPDYAEACNNLGIILADRGEVDAAIAHFQKALEIKPDYAKAHNNLGVALRKRGQPD
jgi:Flp pilus assembly protein TadD